MIDGDVFKKNTCRVCKSKNLTRVINLGSTPLANEFLNLEQKDKGEVYYPLEVYFCNNCTFVQLGHVVAPEKLFSNYVYVSSTSQVFVDHFVKFSENACKRFKLDENSLVVDIGSNDGILLKPFKKRGVKVLGIEPAKKIAEVAKKEGIDTLPYFISENLGKKINNKYGKANLITVTNVFAHIDKLDEVINSIKKFIYKNGVLVIEVPYLVDFIKNRYFDLIYHEHLSYWRVATFIKFFESFKMEVFDVEKVSVHGGSIRIYIANKSVMNVNTENIKKFINLENKNNLNKVETYLNFAKKIEENKILLLNLLFKLKKSGKKIAGYGAPAKGNTLLNYFNIGLETLDYIIDDSPWKQNLYTPGKKIPVFSSKYLNKNNVDFMFILAWNFANSIISKNINFSKKGGKFIIPVPKPRII